MWGIDDVESPTERALGLNLMAMDPPIIKMHCILTVNS